MNMALGMQVTEADSAGNAMNRYQTYAQSTEAKINDLQNAIQQMWMKMLSSETINKTIIGFTNIIEVFGRVMTSSSGLSIVIMTLIDTLIIFKAKAITDAAIGLEKFVVSLFSATSATEAFNVVVSSNPLGLIATALTIVIPLMISYSNAQEKIKQQQADIVTAQENFNKVLKEYESTLDPSKLNAVSTALESIKTATQYDEAVKKIDQLTKSIQEYEKETLALKSAQGLSDSFQPWKTDRRIAIKAEKDELTKLQEQVKLYRDEEEKTNQVKALSQVVDVNTQNNIAKTVLLKEQQLESDKKLVQQYEASIVAGKEDKDLKDKILEKYPQYLKVIDEHTGLTGINTSALTDNINIQETLAKTEIVTAQVSMRASLEKTKTFVSDTQTRIQALKNEIAIYKLFSESDSVNLPFGGGTLKLFGGADSSDYKKSIDDAYKEIANSENSLSQYLAASKIQGDFVNLNPDDILKSYKATASKGSFIPSPKGSGGSTGLSSSDLVKEEKDSYLGLNQALTDVNNSLELNKTLQEQANNESIPLLNEEIALLEKKKQALNDILWQQKKDVNDKRYTLESGYGVKFNENGTPDVASYYSLLNSKENQLKNTKSGTAEHDALTTEINNLKATYTNYIDLFQNKIPSSTREMLKVGTEIAKINNDKISLSLKNAEKDARTLDKALDDISNSLETIGDNNIQGKMDLLNKKWKAANDLVWYWNEEMKKFPEGSEQWNKAREYVVKYTKELKSATSVLEELNKKQVEATNSTLKDYASELEAMMKLEEKAHTDKLQHIDEEKKAFDDMISDRISKLQEEKDAQNYNQDVSKLAQEITDLQNERATYAMATQSGDTEAISKVKDLDKQIADKKTSLADKQSNREFDLRKKKLEDIKRTNDDSYDSAKTTENKKYELLKNAYDQMKTDLDKFISDGINANANMTTTIAKDWDTLSVQFGSSTQTMAKNFETVFLSKLQQAKTQIQSIQSQLGISPNLSTSDQISTISQMKANSSEWNTANNNRKTILESENQRLGKSLGWTYDDATGIWYDKNGTRAYANGTDDVLSMVGENGRELTLLNPNNTKSVIPNGLTENLVKFAQNPLNFMNNIMSNINIPKINTAGANGYGNVSFGDIKIYAQSVDKNSIPDLTNQIFTQIKRELNIGGQFRR